MGPSCLPGYPRLKLVEKVGIEPTTSALQPLLCRLSYTSMANK